MRRVDRLIDDILENERGDVVGRLPFNMVVLHREGSMDVLCIKGLD